MPSTRKIRQLIAPRLDIPFARDDANRYLPYFIALMIFLAAFFLAGGITVGTLLEHKKQSFSEWVTLQAPANFSKKQASSLNTLLKNNKSIAAINHVKKDEITELLSPWFGGDKEVVEALNVPQLIEIKLTDNTIPNIEKLKKTINNKFPDIDIDNQEKWLDHYLSFIKLLEAMSYFLAILIVIATTIIIIFTSKTALKLHKDAIHLLHSVGAEDDYIARQFQFNAFMLGMRGGLIGVSIAAALFFFIGLSINEINTALIPSFPITPSHLALWFVLPPITGLLALLVARKTVLAMLRKMA